MNAQLKTNILEYLNSFDDIEPLGIYEMTDLFAKANRLLHDVLEDDNHPEEFPIATVSKEDFELYGFDTTNLTSEDIEKVANRMGKFYLEGYADTFGADLATAAEYWDIPKKKEEPEIMVADLAGRMVGWDKWQQVYYLGAAYGHNDGIVYKNQQAFDEHDGICYVPEHGFFDANGLADNVSDEMKEWLEEDHCGYVTDGAGGYTRDDIYAAFAYHINYDGWLDEKEKEYGKPFMEEFIDKEIDYIFQELDWQCPDTFIQEMEWEEDWEEFVKDRLDDPRLTGSQAKELGYK